MIKIISEQICLDVSVRPSVVTHTQPYSLQCEQQPADIHYMYFITTHV